MPRIAILISGSGTNLEAILQAIEGGKLPGVEPALVVSNRREAHGIKRAVKHGVPVIYFPLAPYTEAGRPRREYDADLANIIRSFGVTWIVQAGWMHVFSSAFLDHFPSQVINLHPALPGTFPGTHGIERAYEAFQKGEIAHTGVMVHLVPDEGVDVGPVVVQEVVEINPDDSLDDLEERIHATEHRIFVQALHKLLCR
ncbi:MAG: phosphoribosylglycinamide formyltransferase [Anaerolineae bacterium]|jgi:formyltetrahydrofolate-dependent phosphoribosylglycinamide formyltransferase